MCKKALISEPDGPTPKFRAIPDKLTKHLEYDVPDIPQPMQLISINTPIPVEYKKITDHVLSLHYTGNP